jgi:hypothetical protein
MVGGAELDQRMVALQVNVREGGSGAVAAFAKRVWDEGLDSLTPPDHQGSTAVVGAKRARRRKDFIKSKKV